MKKIIAIIILSIMSTASFADGHSGKIDLKGFFVGDAKVILDDKGNMLTFTYEGIAGYEAQGDTTFGDKSSHYCLGAGTIPGKGVELGHCKIMFLDGDTAMIFYEIPLGKPMDGTFTCISGTGKYEGIECSGSSGYQGIKSAQENKIHASNYYKGTYTLKK
jgi:hypothetical protein|tara:strand:- start:49 stop:531 length:483 start_codon:yes stop_codon:yes gene_type:complete